MSTLAASVAAAYSATASSWTSGAARVYDHLATELVTALPGGATGRRLLDLGAGTGAASRAAIAAGASEVVALDIAIGMLALDAAVRPPALVGDATGLPFKGGAFDGVVAAFSLNHVAAPERALAEVARVLSRDGTMIASAYASDDDHPVKSVVDHVCRHRGWVRPNWYAELVDQAVPVLGSLAGARAVLARSGIHGLHCEQWSLDVPGLSPAELVAWRLGLAQVAPFVSSLSPDGRADLVAAAIAELGPSPPPLTRSMIVILSDDRS